MGIVRKQAHQSCAGMGSVRRLWCLCVSVRGGSAGRSGRPPTHPPPRWQRAVWARRRATGGGFGDGGVAEERRWWWLCNCESQVVGAAVWLWWWWVSLSAWRRAAGSGERQRARSAGGSNRTGRRWHKLPRPLLHLLLCPATSSPGHRHRNAAQNIASRNGLYCVSSSADLQACKL